MIVIEGRRPRIAAFIVPSVIGRSKLAEIGKLVFNRMLRDTLGQSIEPVGIPRIWRYIDGLPTNAQGKTTHADLIALLDGESARPTFPLQRSTRKRRPACRARADRAKRLVFILTAIFPMCRFLPVWSRFDWVIAYGRQCFDLPPVFRGIHALKFQRIIAPEKPFTLELVHEPAQVMLVFQDHFASWDA